MMNEGTKTMRPLVGAGPSERVEKSLDRKLRAIHADPHGCREFILADAKDADMAYGIGAPGRSPEAHASEARFRTLAEYRDLMRQVTRQGIVDIMLMSVSSNHLLTIEERLFDDSPVTPAIRANDSTDVHLARGGRHALTPALPFRSASLDHAMCGKLDCQPHERGLGCDLGLYSVTFTNDAARDKETLERFHEFREEAERKGFRYFLEVFDPNVPGLVEPEQLPFFQNDMIARMLAGVGPAGRPLFLKTVWHGPRAMEELVAYDPHLVVGIMGGGAGTTRDAFQLLYDAQKAGAKAALYGRKINQAENQLAFIHLLRLIVEGVIGPVEAVRAYHAVLERLGIRPRLSLEEDLKSTVTATNYAGTTTVAVPSPVEAKTAPAPSPAQTPASSHAGGCRCSHPTTSQPAASVTIPSPTVCRNSDAFPKLDNGLPNFANMTSSQRLAYHRRRLGFG